MAHMFQRSYPHHFLWSISSCGLSSCCCVCCLLRLAAAAPPAAVVLLRSTACRRRRRLCRRHCCSLNACRQLPFSRQDPSGTYLLCVVCLRVLRGLVWWSYAVVFALCFEFQDGCLGFWVLCGSGGVRDVHVLICTRVVFCWWWCTRFHTAVVF